MQADAESIRPGPLASLREHWPEYLCEAALLGAFMVSACVFSIALFHPESRAVGALPSAYQRNVLIGVAMGLTAVALIYSPAGQRSGAHMNPALTLTFWRLGKVAPWDAAFYIVFQFIGGAAGVWLVRLAWPTPLAAPEVRYAATVPGSSGVLAAWIGEFAITLLLMLVVLSASNSRRLSRYTGLFAGILVTLYIIFEAPLSGMSMNPARTFASALFAHVWTQWWIYFTAPPLAMLLGAEIYLALRGRARVYCAKYHHTNHQRCIFRCEFSKLLNPEQISSGIPSHSSAPESVNPCAAQPHLTEQTIYYG